MAQPGPIDIQTHFIPPAVVEALERRPDSPNLIRDEAGRRLMVYGENTAYPLKPSMTDLDLKLEAMDAAGLGMSVLSVNIPGLDWFDENEVVDIARETNDQLAEIVRSRPDRFAAFAALPLRRPEEAAAELERAAGLGLCGAMVYSNMAGRPLEDPAFLPVWEAAANLDKAILIHPTYPLSADTVKQHELVSVLGYMFDTSTAAAGLILSGLYDRHPDFKLILPHTGGVLSYLAGRFDNEGAKGHPEGFNQLAAPPSEYIRRLYVDIVSGFPPAMKLVIDFHGVDHVMYASDHPFWEPEWTRDAFDQLELAPDQRQAIESGNASRILGIAD